MITLSTRTLMFIASAYGANKTFSAASNASQCELSFASDPSLAIGDIVEISSGWGRLNNRLARVDSISGSGPYLVVLEDIDTSDTDVYPAGTGTGTVREVSSWTEITQKKTISASGGEQQFADITAIEDETEKKIPTIRSAVSVSVEVFDDPTLAYVPVVKAAADASRVAGVKMSFPNGSKLYANAYWSMQDVPNIAKNEALTTKIDMSYASAPKRYAS
uniref:Putative phage tail protein n=1 Tax=Candidatus Nitrotoga fabula TaxID=2182327 RepID=A0A2X0R856_9PROT|nr:putative phage tail protein [Candidatus Nitrotoga fabula]